MPIPNIDLSQVAGLRKNSTELPRISTRSGWFNGARGPEALQGLVFDADFDTMADWQIEYRNQRYRFTGDVGFSGSSPGAQENLPRGFDHYYTSQRWHPDGTADGTDPNPGKQPVAQINDFQSRTPGGKSLIIHDESYGSPSQWGSDAVIARELGQEYTELWFEFYIKFQPDWVWNDVLNGGGQTSMKLLRLRRYTGRPIDEGRFSYFGDQQHLSSPEALFRFKSWTQNDGALNRLRVSAALNGYQSEEDVEAGNLNGDGSPNGLPGPESSIRQGTSNELSWTDLFLNGQWHKVNFYAKMDSFAGAGDGVVEAYVNDHLEMRKNDIPWRRPGDADVGWDWFAIGGNMSNVPFPEEDKHQQWYAVSDLKIFSRKPDNNEDN